MAARFPATIRVVKTSPFMRIGLLIPATLAVALSAPSFDAGAQGFPGGGGGHGGMGRGMRPPRDGDRPSAPPGQPPQDPLVTFLGTLHALRAAIIVRDDQASAWTSMQDALLALADAEHPAPSLAQGTGDPAARLRAYVDALGMRAAATKTAADRIAAVVALLDDTQKTLFLAGLGEAFAGTGQRP
jgi:hypothetical protein